FLSAICLSASLPVRQRSWNRAPSLRARAVFLLAPVRLTRPAQVEFASFFQAHLSVAQFLRWPHLVRPETSCVQLQHLWLCWPRRFQIQLPLRSPVPLLLWPFQAHLPWLRASRLSVELF